MSKAGTINGRLRGPNTLSSNPFKNGTIMRDKDGCRRRNQP